MKETVSDQSAPAERPHRYQKELRTLLARGERIEQVYPTTGRILLFTNKRLICLEPDTDPSLAAVQSIPYRSVTRFSLEPSDGDARWMQLRIWVHGDPEPLSLAIAASADSERLHGDLSEYVLNRHSQWLNSELNRKKRAALSKTASFGLTALAVGGILFMKKNRAKGNLPCKTGACCSKLPALGKRACIKTLFKGGF